MTDPFVMYLDALVSMGHDRDWVRRYTPVLRQRFATDREPFPCLPARHTGSAPVDRYDEL